MQVVSFETAKRLKEAGFPQPDTAFGAFWYVVFNDGTFKAFNSAYGYMASWWLWDTQTPSDRPVMANPIQWEQRNEAKVYFAPSPTDILKELGITYSFGYNEETGLFECFVNEYDEWWQHKNPAEACAEAWLVKKLETTSNMVKEGPEV